MAAHRVFVAELPPAGRLVEVTGEESRHALRVKRIAAGDPLLLLDGRGGVGEARVASAGKARGEWVLAAEVLSVRRVAPVSPRVEIVSAVPKGDRLERMIDGLSQIGVARWSGLESERTVVEPGESKRDRIARVAIESSKQCGRAWLMEVGAALTFDEAIRADGAPVLLADASGGDWEFVGASCRIVIGPEGGWSDRERRGAAEAGARIVRLGPHVMRTETAAQSAAALALHRAREGGAGQPTEAGV